MDIFNLNKYIATNKPAADTTALAETIKAIETPRFEAKDGATGIITAVSAVVVAAVVIEIVSKK